jgi:hypothetical protein
MYSSVHLIHPVLFGCCCCACSIPKEKYFPVPGVDGALVTFKLLPPSKRVQAQGERGFVSLVSAAPHVLSCCWLGCTHQC